MARKSTEERRTQISQALLRAMAEHGYAKATIAKIAEEADLTAGLIHYHFDSKREILLVLLDELVDRQRDQLQQAVEAADGPVAQLEVLVAGFLAVGEQARPDAVAAWVTIAAEAIRQPEVRTAYAEALESFRDLIAQVVDAGLQQGVFQTGSLSREAATAAILSTIQGYFSLAATARQLIPEGSAAPATWRMLQGLLGFEAEER